MIIDFIYNTEDEAKACLDGVKWANEGKCEVVGIKQDKNDRWVLYVKETKPKKKGKS